MIMLNRTFMDMFYVHQHNHSKNKVITLNLSCAIT